jgi:hypothetical protein
LTLKGTIAEAEEFLCNVFPILTTNPDRRVFERGYWFTLARSGGSNEKMGIPSGSSNIFVAAVAADCLGPGIAAEQ